MLTNTIRPLARLVRNIARNMGYEITSSQKFGVDMPRDVNRLCEAWSRDVLVAMDVGANIGQTALQFCRVFPRARIFSFEPTPGVYETLRKSVRHLPNVYTFQVALGAMPGTAEFFVHEYSQINSLVPNAPHTVRYGTTGKAINCEVTSLDAFCEQHAIDRINLLKIDTEGAELSVLHGARELLSSARIDFVYVEFNDLFQISGSAGGALVPICEFMIPFGFRFVASYTDFVETKGNMFVISNALLARN